MKKRKLLVRKMAHNVRQVNHDLRFEYGVAPHADREMTTLEKKVSPQLYGMLMQQLLGFHGDMQLEMAENLVVFACDHIAHTTGCDSVDMVLDVCYSWIAAEQGILKKATMGFDDFYIEIKKLRAENSQLKREVRRLRKELQK